MKERLRITEIFLSLQGETSLVGLPTAFIRLTGCPLRCQYCDTAYAFYGGKYLSIDEIISQVSNYKIKHVTVTGGEPLAQPLCLDLLSLLCDKKYIVSLETSGALDISLVDQRVIKIVDLKTPGSNEMHRNLLQNLKYLNSHDQVKFVICDRHDYEWAVEIVNQYQINLCCEVLFSCSHQQMDVRQLADWIVADQLPVRFQLQMHKYIWGDQPGK